MRALILAAGIGQRLGVVSAERPKCLLEFAGRSLLERHMDILADCGIDGVILAVGYQADLLQQTIDALDTPLDIRTRVNPDYTEGSVVSLWTLREELRAGEDVLLMDADVLYDARMIERLCATGKENCLLLDRQFEAGDEPVKVCIRAGRLVEFRKQLAPDLVYDFAGESVGFFRIGADMAARLANACQDYLDLGLRETPYEEVIRDQILARPEAFGYEDISGIPWLEIDFPEDIQRAEQEILPQISSQ